MLRARRVLAAIAGEARPVFWCRLFARAEFAEVTKGSNGETIGNLPCRMDTARMSPLCRHSLHLVGSTIGVCHEPSLASLPRSGVGNQQCRARDSDPSPVDPGLALLHEVRQLRDIVRFTHAV